MTNNYSENGGNIWAHLGEKKKPKVDEQGINGEMEKHKANLK